jgi:chromosome segregation ATPase
MNKSNSEVFLKKNIVMYAKKIRDIQQEQVNPYIELIEKSLSELYPSLVDRDDGVPNWACDIVSADSNTEVMNTLDRIEQILEKEYKDKWVCCVCGENTYNVDCEYLAGVDHLSCLTIEELKQEKKNQKNDQLHELKNQLSNLQTYVSQLEKQLARLEENYDETTN